MAKFLLASDFQLGRQFHGLGRSGDLVRKALKGALENSMTLALESSVDLFVISGNLFATNLVSRNLIDFLYRQVDRLGRIPCVIVPGQFDCLDSNSIYRHLPSENRPENLYVLGATHDSIVNFADSEITIYGVPDQGDDPHHNGWQIPPRTNYDGVHVLVVANRQSVEGYPQELNPRIRDLVSGSIFDFVAVGASPTYRQWNQETYSSGSAEALDFDNGNSGLCLLVEAEGTSIHVEPNPIGRLNWKRLVIDSDKFLYNIEIERELQKLTGADTLLRLEIGGSNIGEGYLDIKALENNQSEHFCHLQISDNRDLKAGNVRINSENGGSLIGEFTTLIQDGIEKAPTELKSNYIAALATGRALLTGKDVI